MGYRLPIPAGVLIGTLAMVGAGSVLGSTLLGLPQPPVPSWINGTLQIMLGMLVGFRMSREELRSGVRALVPASLLSIILISTTIITALIVARLTYVDLVTALFATAPGGLTEMSVVSLGFGADGAAVTTVQLVRVLLALAIIDILLKWFESKNEPASNQEQDDDAPAEETELAEDLKELGIAAPWGILGGLVGIVSQAPASGIVGALIGAAAFRLLTGRPVPVSKYQLAVQGLGGVVIGLSVSSDFLGELVRYTGAWFLIISTQMLLWLAAGWMLVKVFRYDLPTATLASSPGGLSAAISTAEPSGADVVIVTFIHLERLSTIIVVVPLFVTLLFGS